MKQKSSVRKPQICPTSAEVRHVVFLVLAAQFERIASAVVIMLTVPFWPCCHPSCTLNHRRFAELLQADRLDSFDRGNGEKRYSDRRICQSASRGRTGYRQRHRGRLAAAHLPRCDDMVSTIFGGLPLELSSGAGGEARVAVGCATYRRVRITPRTIRAVAISLLLSIRSPNNNHPISTAKRIEVSLRAATSTSGATVIAQTAIA